MVALSVPNVSLPVKGIGMRGDVSPAVSTDVATREIADGTN